ncbi:hypothetical protein FQR65_LT12128 [Abscondita terminalis]|nr:hypothetical protein FQR65_LT12128 [Abscondita terminalis]
MFNICNHKALLKELTCKQCSKFLSVLPVYYSSAMGNICGRCIESVDWMIANGTVERALAYEAIAKFLVFPCSNYANGCEAKLNSVDMAKHEQQCQCVIAPCPFNLEMENVSMKCDWKGIGKKLGQHLQDSHKDFLQVSLSSFILNVYVTYVKIFFTIIDNITFLIITQYLKTVNKFYCIVICCEDSPDHRLYRYQLELGRNNDYFLVLRKPDTEPFSDIQEILTKQDRMIAADVTSIHAMLDDPNGLIFCKIGIFKKPKKEIALIKPSVAVTAPKPPTKAKPKPKAQTANSKKLPNLPKVESKNPLDLSKLKLGNQSNQGNTPNFLDELECPVCNDYMVPPIFICPTGHSICNSCKIKLPSCPLCRLVFQDTRNFTLEKLATTINYPCKYKDLGCVFSLNYEHIGLHQLHCLYAYGRCPLKLLGLCSIKEDFVDLIGHMRENHSNYIVDANRQYSRELAGNITTSYWATICDNEIFIICCKHSTTSGPIKFNVLHVGMNETKPKYKFELQFCDQTGKEDNWQLCGFQYLPIDRFSIHVAMFNICNNEILLNELKCVRCLKILSVFPVYSSSEAGNICGRCINSEDSSIKNGKVQRATAYEAIAKFVLFPCSNQENGCLARLNSEQVVQHEKKCHFVSSPCPFNLELESISSKCNWRGTEANIAEHLQSNHQEFMQLGSPSFVINTNVTHLKIFFTLIDNLTFLTITQYLKTTNKFYNIVMCCEKSPTHQHYRYQLELGSNNDYFLILRKPQTEPFGNVQEIVNKQENMIAADVAGLQALIEDPNGSIFYKTCIMKKPNAMITKPKPNESFQKETSELKVEDRSNQLKVKSNNVLDELECPVCYEYMKPPIFICPTGHSICSSCRMKIQACPSCSVPIKDARNFTLEKLAMTVKYPCKYTDLGCAFVLKYEQMQAHELHCWYASERCPFKFLGFSCGDENRDTIAHLHDKHSSFIMETDHIYSRDLIDNVKTTYWTTIFENNVFLICCKHGNTTEPIKFNVLHHRMKKSQPKYKYQLKFYDQTGNGLKLIISQLCQIIPSNQALIFEKCVSIPQDLMEPFVDKKSMPVKFFFKFQIKYL